MITKHCKICGKEFKVPVWRALTAKYCSKECQSKSLKAESNLVCPACGKTFHRKPSHINRFKGLQGFFCSKECAKKGMSERMTGDANHQFGLKGDKNASYKGGVVVKNNHSNTEYMVYCPERPDANKYGRVYKHRLIVCLNHELFDDKYFDIIDGFYCLKKGIIVHHKDGNHSNNTLGNLQPMTKSEHTSVHNKLSHRKRNSKGQFV